MSLGSLPKASAAGPEAERFRLGARPLRALGLFAALALAGSVLLWAHYGTTVFFETIRAGFTACFG
jgi:hypothetical protein